MNLSGIRSAKAEIYGFIRKEVHTCHAGGNQSRCKIYGLQPRQAFGALLVSQRVDAGALCRTALSCSWLYFILVTGGREALLEDRAGPCIGILYLVFAVA